MQANVEWKETVAELLKLTVIPKTVTNSIKENILPRAFFTIGKVVTNITCSVCKIYSLFLLSSVAVAKQQHGLLQDVHYPLNVSRLLC